MGKSFLRFRYIVLAIVMVMGMVVSASGSSFAADNDSAFSFPLKTKKVIKKFVPPSSAYAPGHRGVDFEAPSGTKAFAVADGQVIFAGLVAGRLFVTVDHGSNIKSTYAYLGSKRVVLGQKVRKGDVVGLTGEPGPQEVKDSFHFSLRINDKYVDPLPYLSGKIPVRDINLAAIPQKKKSLLDRVRDKEKSALEKFIKFVDDVTYTPDEFINDVLPILGQGIDGVKDSYKNVQKRYKDAIDAISSVNKKAREILSNAAKGFKDAVKKGISELKKLQKNLHDKISKFAKAAKSILDRVGGLIKSAAKYGIEAVKAVVNATREVIQYVTRSVVNTIAGVADFVKSVGKSTILVVDSYLGIDTDMLKRIITEPWSCFQGKCSIPITLDCDITPSKSIQTKKDGYKGSGNSVLVVSGLNSSAPADVNKHVSDSKKQPVDIPWKTLGYDKGDVQYYSYAGEGKAFEGEDTYQDLHVSAAKMDAQVKQFAKDNPGKKLDFLTHSLGGSVTSVWLAEFYDPKNKAYPPIGKMVMFAPPLGGTQLASSGKEIDGSQGGREFHDNVADRIPDLLPPTGTKSIQQVTEGGDAQKILEKSGIAKKVKIYSIRTGSDLIVTSASGHVDGVTEIPLATEDGNLPYVPDSLVKKLAKGTVKAAYEIAVNSYAASMAHSNITTQKDAVIAAQSILEGSKPPCASPSKALKFIEQSAIVHAAELYIGRQFRDAADVGD